MDFKLPHAEDPAEMPGHVKMSYPAGTAWLFNGRTYHAALHNASDTTRKVLIYNYGHFWMKPWQGYEPGPEIQAKAKTPAMKQLLHMGNAYGQHLTE
jgi:ectoine hydroxylase-related dioxygenase (phytanoyl-CoA dioxygenase family)